MKNSWIQEVDFDHKLYQQGVYPDKESFLAERKEFASKFALSASNAYVFLIEMPGYLNSVIRKQGIWYSFDKRGILKGQKSYQSSETVRGEPIFFGLLKIENDLDLIVNALEAYPFTFFFCEVISQDQFQQMVQRYLQGSQSMSFFQLIRSFQTIHRMNVLTAYEISEPFEEIVDQTKLIGTIEIQVLEIITCEAIQGIER